MSLSIERIDLTLGRESRAQLIDYLGIKFQVFRCELGWPIPANEEQERAEEDAFDRAGLFVLARSERGECIGCARALPIQRGFPHRNLLEGLMAEYGRGPEATATINSVALLPSYRGRDLEGNAARSPHTVAAILVRECHSWLRELGMEVCLLTTTPKVAESFFAPLGYEASDERIDVDWSDVPLVNMGTWLDRRGETLSFDGAYCPNGAPTS